MIKQNRQSASDWRAYRKAQNQVNKALGAAYCTHLFDNAHTNNKKRFWSIAKHLRKNHQFVATLCVENELKASPSSKLLTIVVLVY